MENLKKIEKALTEAGYGDMLNYHKGDLFINCADTQAIRENEDGTIRMNTVGGSRYCYPDITNVEDCIRIMLEQCAKSKDDINSEYKQIFNKIRE